MLNKQYKITYINALAETVQAFVCASSKVDALARLDLEPHNVVSITTDFAFGDVLPISIQMQILTRISGGVVSGEAITQYLPAIVNDFRELKPYKETIEEEINQGRTLSNLLGLLGLHSIVISLIKNGERAGSIADSIKNAKQFLRLEEKTKKSTVKTLQTQLIILALALFLIFGFPLFVEDFYAQMDASGIIIDVNYSTEILFFLAAYGYIIATVLFIITIAITLMRKQFLQTFGDFYPVSIFDNIVSSKQAILFLSIFMPLYKAKSNIGEIIESYKSINKTNADKIKQATLSGVSISDSVQQLYFSRTFKSGFKGFNRVANKEAKLNMLEELFECVIEDLDTYGQQAAILIKLIANFLIYAILVILVHGFMAPQLSMRVF